MCLNANIFRDAQQAMRIEMDCCPSLSLSRSVLRSYIPIEPIVLIHVNSRFSCCCSASCSTRAQRHRQQQQRQESFPTHTQTRRTSHRQQRQNFKKQKYSSAPNANESTFCLCDCLRGEVDERRGYLSENKRRQRRMQCNEREWKEKAKKTTTKFDDVGSSI